MRRFTYELNKNEILSIQETIAKINFYLNNYKNEILDLCKTEKDLENQMGSKLGTKVEITRKTLTISYNGVDDLNRILEIIGCLEESEADK